MQRLYAAQPVCGPYLADMQPICSLHTAYIQRCVPTVCHLLQAVNKNLLLLTLASPSPTDPVPRAVSVVVAFGATVGEEEDV